MITLTLRVIKIDIFGANRIGKFWTLLVVASVLVFETVNAIGSVLRKFLADLHAGIDQNLVNLLVILLLIAMNTNVVLAVNIRLVLVVSDIVIVIYGDTSAKVSDRDGVDSPSLKVKVVPVAEMPVAMRRTAERRVVAFMLYSYAYVLL